MAVTENTYTGNGSTDTYSFTFPYLDAADIKVSLNGTPTTAYTLATATTIQFNTAPANGVAIRIYRVTDDAALNATFISGSAIRAQDLNSNFTQNLYVTQESGRDATEAITTAESAVTTANSAVTTANTAVSTANSAVTTANSAVSTANSAVSTANSAVTTANSAVTTANTAVSTANSAVTTANTASANASAALTAAAEALAYTVIADVAAIPVAPANGDAVRILDSTGVESFTPLSSIPVGFTGDPGLTVEIYYDSGTSSWVWVRYYATDPELRYIAKAGDTMTGALVLNADPTANLGAATKQYVDTAVGNVATDAISEGNTSAEVIDTGSDGRFVVTTEGTERLRVDSSGRLGIGTTTPQAHLDVRDNVGGNARLDIHSQGANGMLTTLVSERSGPFRISSESNTAAIAFNTGSSGTSERARIDSSGRLLVGTSSSVYSGRKLQIVDDGTGIAEFASGRNDGFGPTISFTKSRGSTASPSIVSNGDALGVITFDGYDGSTKRTGAEIRADVDGTPGSADLPSRLVFSTTADGASSPTERMRISQNGFIDMPGVYSFTTANAANVNVDTTGGMRRSTSSKKYKTDIETLQDSYADALLDCRPVWYRSTCEADCPEHSYWGFIAEEVAAIDPRLVHWKTVEITYDENGSPIETPCDQEPEGVQYDRFVPHLLNLIKRQGEAIAELQAEVAALKGL